VIEDTHRAAQPAPLPGQRDPAQDLVLLAQVARGSPAPVLTNRREGRHAD